MKIPKFAESTIASLTSKCLSHFGKHRLSLTSADIRNMRISFSQYGEDLVIAECLLNNARERRGIYVDAGCFDPVRFSNTRLLNLLGWRGINVDASAAAIAKFQVVRPYDINIHAALAGEEQTNEFIQTESGATSRLANGGAPLPAEMPVVQKNAVITRTLKDIMDSTEFRHENVDLLDIDCEGIDLDVLVGFGVETRRPRVICIEAHGENDRLEITRYLKKQKYGFISDRGPSLLFCDTLYSK